MAETRFNLDLFEAAHTRIAPYVERTPLLPARNAGEAGKSRLWLKLESQQPTGSFKVRPAFNGILCHLEAAQARGVLTSSSGNFGQAVAYAARRFSVSAQVVMMSAASEYKRRRTESYGAEVVVSGNRPEERLALLQKLHQESGRVLLHQYDSVESIAGDGTIGLELASQLDRDFTLVVPVSGGGLISGVATALKARRPGCQIIGVLPPSHRWGEKLPGVPTALASETIADALVPATPGSITLPLAQASVNEFVMVTDSEIRGGLRCLVEEQKFWVEPGGAVGFAAWRTGKFVARHEDVVFLVSGGNVAPARMPELL